MFKQSIATLNISALWDKSCPCFLGNAQSHLTFPLLLLIPILPSSLNPYLLYPECAVALSIIYYEVLYAHNICNVLNSKNLNILRYKVSLNEAFCFFLNWGLLFM